jgi:hypothetical protein
MNALFKFIQCVMIIWIHFFLLSEKGQSVSLTYHSELIVSLKTMGPAIRVAAMARHTLILDHDGHC